uniref:Uncharacterized protein n=1 Tax=Acrobeloides nanus TaxID=290746 RepID=A0A914D6E8_9BILA
MHKLLRENGEPMSGVNMAFTTSSIKTTFGNLTKEKDSDALMKSFSTYGHPSLLAVAIALPIQVGQQSNGNDVSKGSPQKGGQQGGAPGNQQVISKVARRRPTRRPPR